LTSIRVCYIANQAIDFVPEGHNTASRGIIQAAIHAGIDAQVVTLEKSLSSSRQGFYPIRILSQPRHKTSYFPSLAEFISTFPAMLVAKALNCDIIHLLNVTKELFSATQMFLKINTPRVAHLYHSYLPFLSYTSFKFRFLLLKLGIFDYIFCSNMQLKNYLALKGLNPNHVHYIPYPVDIERFRPYDKGELRRKHRLPPNIPIITYVGAIDPNRGFFVLLRAFKEISKDFPQALLYICHPRSNEEKYVQFIRSIFGSRIIVQGSNSRIEEAYSLASVVVLPFREPYWIIDPPVVLLEAMASATPVITTPLGAIGEIGKDKKNMIFSSPGNSNSLGKAIKYVLKNQDEAEKIGLNARETAKTRFSQEVVGKTLNRAYKEILEC